jgi:RNA polymerase sigma factor (sigma-70 family)
MKRTHGSGTHVSLLGRLRDGPDDAEAWSAFVEQYGRRIYEWSRRWGLQEADARDVTQNVLLKLAEKMREFTYDPARSFRAWLKTLTRHACSDFREARRRPGQGTGDSAVGRLLDDLEAREDLVGRMEELFDQELLQEAMARARLRVAPQTWQAFALTALEGLSGAAAAARIPMQVAQVFVAKRRVQKMLREEVARLDQSGPA